MKKKLYKTNQNDPAVLAYKEAVEKGKKNNHVLPRDNGWIVKNFGSGKASQAFSTQQEATEYAHSIAIAGTAVFVHNSDGRIRERKEY